MERDAVAVQSIMGEDAEDSVFTSQSERVCPKCGKTSMVETLTIVGWREHKEASCPVCDAIVAEDSCWKIHANLLKVF